jgi:hypothetical protein
LDGVRKGGADLQQQGRSSQLGYIRVESGFAGSNHLKAGNMEMAISRNQLQSEQYGLAPRHSLRAFTYNVFRFLIVRQPLTES